MEVTNSKDIYIEDISWKGFWKGYKSEGCERRSTVDSTRFETKAGLRKLEEEKIRRVMNERRNEKRVKWKLKSITTYPTTWIHILPAPLTHDTLVKSYLQHYSIHEKI